METLKQIVIYVGGMIVAIAAFHIFILFFMILGILVGSDQIQHTSYWDGLLRAVIQFLT